MKILKGTGIFLLGCFFLVTMGIVGAETTCNAAEIGWQGPYPYAPAVEGFQDGIENQKIIKTYDTSNADEVKGLVPDIQIEWLKDPETWGPFVINETPYRKFEPTPGYQAASEKYKGTCKLADDGLLLNWVAGLPFKNPQTGWEVAWNYEKRNKWDDVDFPYVSPVVDKSGKVKHFLKGDWRRLYFVGRTEVDPKPEYPNDKGLELMDSYGYTDPYDMRGIIPRYYRYVDQYKPDDMWMYIPTMRRVRRMSTAQRMDTPGGGNVYTWDDFQGFAGKVMQYDWKLVGRQEALLPRMGKGHPEWVDGRHLANVNNYYQKVNAYIVECIPKDPNHIYSKSVFWVDPESWHFCYAMRYDRGNRLWRIFNTHISYHANGSYLPSGMTCIDVQTEYSSNPYVYGSYSNVGWKPDAFSWKELQSIYPSR
ncbi:MAG: DUF1329 domain-containing protein [Deltaproteobacteria bacterium]|nr:DUF1329 domain-containing protein [Deltaproteobacteria bacterium]